MRTCNANGATGTLSGTQPTCSPVSCGAAPDGTNSTATETSTVYNGLATYTCNSGYVASTGNATRTCGAGGTWSGSALNCVIGDCGPAPAAGANATLTMTGGTTSGATASYACNAGSGMGTGVASRTCQVTSGVAGWTPTGASLACVATPTTCNLVYDFGAPPGGGARFRIDPQTTIASAATRNIGAGKIVLRVAADSNGRPATSGAIEVLYYDMDQYFSLSGVTTETRICLLNPASAVPTVPTSAPPPEQNMMAACITPSNTTPMATGTFTRTGGTGTATFSCYDPAPTGNNYTPAQATGTAAGCLTRWFSYGRIFCNGLCGLVLPQNVWIDKSAQWSQHLLPLNLSSNLATLTMGNGGGSARGDFAHVPNTDNGWTGFALSGAVNTSESTCVLTGL